MIFKRRMSTMFEMTDLGLLSSCLGIQVVQHEGENILSQKLRFNQKEGTDLDSTLYRSLIGSLKYLTHMRPDLLFSVSFLNRYMENPISEHLKCAKRLLRYIKGTLDFGLRYKQGKNFDVKGYCDSDDSGDFEEWKSTSGFIFFLSENAVMWVSQKQRIVALSSCETKYVSLTLVASQVI
ncbi:unnamed protein product [Spirodela intermedia]|uniref:Uncharacterized protein n=1 Tax=Spirodela intermedia TaxID=51605 RepID=A0A7I8JPN9_SPIIN|nr:unnamed protein product [Spirodela intermedia]CAA6672147.1 unnamed protein product [Spirodela intermedia]